MIYLDNASTTQVDPMVVEAMLPYLKYHYGNPGSLHKLGTTAKMAVDEAREKVAAMINAEPDQIIFTSGGSEANNMVIKNALLPNWKFKVACSAVEHDSILSIVSNSNKGRIIKVDHDGLVTQEALLDVLNDNVGLVSIMYVNNETGAVNNIKALAKICRSRGVLFHTDCVQAIACKKIDVKALDVDFLSISSHKIHGCKGVGCLFVRDKRLISSLISGGHAQEFGLRGGTENVPGIVGFGEACFIHYAENPVDYTLMRDHLCMKLSSLLPDDSFRVNCSSVNDHGKIVSITFDGVDAQTLVMMLNIKDVLISTGSACTSHETTPSHVLKAIGMSDEEANNTIRISFSKYTTYREIDIAAEKIADWVKFVKTVEEK